MVRKVPGWTDIIIRACLEGMGEFYEDETEMSGLENWLREDVSRFFSCFSLHLRLRLTLVVVLVAFCKLEFS